MDPETKELLEETLKVSRENNRLLRKMQSAILWGRIFKIIYWIIILGSIFGLYYFLQPVIDSLGEAYTGFGTSIEKAKGVLDALPGAGNI